MAGVWKPDTADIVLGVRSDGTLVDFSAASVVRLLVERHGGAQTIPLLVNGTTLTAPGGTLAAGVYDAYVVATLDGKDTTYPDAETGPARLVVRDRPAVG